MCIGKDAEKRGKDITEAHWDYVKGVLKTHGITDDIIKISGHHFVTAMEHGFGHGVEWARLQAKVEYAPAMGKKNRSLKASVGDHLLCLRLDEVDPEKISLSDIVAEVSNEI